jgi:hypothetical protein
MGKKFDLQADYLVKFMAMAEPDRKGFFRKSDRHVLFFDKALPLIGHSGLNDAAEGPTEDGAFVFADATYVDVDRNIDICVLSTITDDNSSNDAKLDGGYSLTRVRKVSAKAIRGKTRIFAPQILEWTIGIVDTRHRFSSQVKYFGSYNGGGSWRCLTTGNALDDDLQQKFPLYCGLEFNKQLYWHVYLGIGLNPRLKFMTDAAGAMEAFKLRDVPPGKKRRASLRNWISAHWRKKHDDPDIMVAVRKHLRGTLKFDWNGLRCQIVPSLDAIRENEELRQAARLMPLSKRRKRRKRR